jgi:hypothetical protein
MRWFALAAVAVVALGGCGKKEKPLAQPITTAGAAASPTPAASAAAATSPPGASAATKTTPKPGATATPKGTTGPVTSARPGGYNTPKPGTYLYTLGGSRKNPGTNGQDKPYDRDAMSKVQLDVTGTEYKTTRVDQNGDDGSTVQRARLETNRVLLLQVTNTSPFGDVTCVYDPPVEVFHLPPKAETFPEQRGGSADKCQWTFKVKVPGQETITDAAGQSWNTWKVEIETDQTINTSFGPVQIHLVLKTWISPDLGQQIRSEESSSVNSGAFTSNRTTLLKSHP